MDEIVVKITLNDSGGDVDMDIGDNELDENLIANIYEAFEVAIRSLEALLHKRNIN